MLTSIHADGDRVDQSSVSPVLTHLCEGLKTLRRGGDPPQLVVLGDLFELALCSTEDAAATFAHLLAALKPGSPDAAVAPVILFIPGNHDHHFWSRARGDAFMKYMAEAPPGQPLIHEPNATHLLPRHDTFKVRDNIVEQMATRASTAATLKVEQSYPNLGLVNSSGSRVVVLSHGHFIEPLYRAMSVLEDLFDRGRPESQTVHELEAENGAWIDFFWSSMGDSGDVSSWARDVYESLQSDDAIHAEIKAIRRAIIDRRGAKWRKHAESAVVGGMLLTAAQKSLRRERHVSEVLSANAKIGLTRYLSGPVSTQVKDEIGNPDQVTFVFGHTHKPFIHRNRASGLPGPVPVINTGGWVIDSPKAEPYKGAAIVLIDEDLNVAVLRCYTQGASVNEELRIDGPESEATNPLVDDLRSRIDLASDPWLALAHASSEIELERRQQLENRNRTETVLLKRERDG